MSSIEILPLANPIKASVNVPGSKSFTNRALIISALAKGKSKLFNFSKSDDSVILISSLNKLGINITSKNNTLIVNGNGGNFSKNNIKLNVGKTGTAMRFLTALCTLVPGKIILDGDKQMQNRPIGELVNSLRQIGASIKYRNNNGFPPLEITGNNIMGGLIKIKGDVSSQFITSLLLIAPLLKNGLKIKIIGNEVSKSYTKMTLQTQSLFGVKIKQIKGSYLIHNKQYYKSQNFIIESDISSATYFWGIAAITGSRITVNNIYPKSFQGDILFLNILRKMGCIITINSKLKSVEVKGPKILKPVKANLSLLPDSAQTLSVISAFANGRSTLSGLSTLKIKETNRLLALKNELFKMGITSKIGKDFIQIEGGKPNGAKINTYNDHRMAMSFAIAGTKIPGIVIKNPEVVSKSFPNFWESLSKLGIKYKLR